MRMRQVFNSHPYPQYHHFVVSSSYTKRYKEQQQNKNSSFIPIFHFFYFFFFYFSLNTSSYRQSTLQSVVFIHTCQSYTKHSYCRYVLQVTYHCHDQISSALFSSFFFVMFVLFCSSLCIVYPYPYITHSIIHIKMQQKKKQNKHIFIKEKKNKYNNKSLTDIVYTFCLRNLYRILGDTRTNSMKF